MNYTNSEKVTNIFNDIFDLDKVKTGKLIDWMKVCKDVIEEVKKNLLEFGSDKQREVYLSSFFRSLADEGKENAFLQIEIEKEKGLSNDVFYYLDNCYRCRQQFITDISEICLLYDNIRFNEIIKNAGIRTDSVWYLKQSNETIKDDQKSHSKLAERMSWLGTQKELAELFVELKQQGWIEGFSYEAIKTCFTNSNTINQVLKPATEKIKNSEGITYKDQYDQVYTAKYNPKFYGIKENTKLNKINDD